MKSFAAILIAGACVACIPDAVSAINIHVPEDFPTIQAALDAAVDGDVILLADGTYTGASNINLNSYGKSITLRSENGADSCVLDCQGAGKGFRFTGSEIVDGVTITNGYADDGGAVSCEPGSAPVIRNCRFISNMAYFGGAITADMSSLIISECEFRENVGFFHGGATYGIDSTILVENSVMSANEALVGGAGVTAHTCSLSIVNCLITDNMAENGAGIGTNYSSVSLTNCTLSGNYASDIGGAIESYNSQFSLLNCILWGDEAWRAPELWLAVNSTMNVEFSDVEGGAAGAVVEGGSSLTWGDGNIDADPLFTVGPVGDFYLSQIDAGQIQTSPCVNAGSDSAEILGFDAYTTRTDHIQDLDQVDMGNHYALPTQISLFSPANGERLSVPPTFLWTVDGETRNGYSVEIKLPHSRWYSTYGDLKLVIGKTSWTMPDSIWRKIPQGRSVSWRVRGADLDRHPLTILKSGIQSFLKE